MENAVYDTISADVWAGDANVDAQKRPYLFRVTGSSIRFLGFLRLYEETRPDDKPQDVNKQLPSDFTEGEAIDMLKLLPEQHFTQPPPRFSEARLVKEMEDNGIGRPSTYAAIVSTIQNRGYVVRENGRLYPTETGEVVNDLLVEYFADILSPDFTARMEDDLDKIAEGADWVPIISNFYEKFAVDVAKADEALPKGALKVEPEPVGRDCPDCEHPLLYRVGRYGRFVGCSNFPTCRYTEQILIKIGVTCPKDGGDLVQKKTRRGRTFYGCANYPDCDWTSWKRPLIQPCDSCGGLLVQSSKVLAECTVCAKKQPLPEQKEENEPMADGG
jgi:DNA topoisomerase-1